MSFRVFYPDLRRQELSAYRNRNGNYYADYKANYELIAQDCLHRCVYCDATVRECGGDNFSLDHFRPKKVFANKFNGALVNHPYNLHLSCQKCNVLKSSDWCGCTDLIDGHTYIEGRGYIDRFAIDTSDYLTVDQEGIVRSSNKSGPADYFIRKLHINRLNRTYLRQLRLLKERLNSISSELDEIINELLPLEKSGEISKDELIKKIKIALDLRKEILEVYSF